MLWWRSLSNGGEEQQAEEDDEPLRRRRRNRRLSPLYVGPTNTGRASLGRTRRAPFRSR